MNTFGLNPLFLDFALYSFFCFLVCLGFMTWYLKRSGRQTEDEPKRSFIWIEILFRYRDYTKANFTKAHVLYHFAILLLLYIVSVFCSGIVLHSRTQDPPFNHLVGLIGIVIFLLLLGIFFHLSKKEYYK